MALLSDYTAGTVSSSGLVITGTGTAWQTAKFREGDEFIADGWRMLVQSVDSETQITLRANSGVQGSALSGAPYRLRYMSDGSRSSAQARQLINMLRGTGTLEGLAGLESAANTMPYFTGPGGAAALTDLTAFGRSLLSLDDSANWRAGIGANDAANLNTGTIPNSRLPSRLSLLSTDATVADVNNAIENGWYWAPMGTPNNPNSTTHFYIHVSKQNGAVAVKQIARDAASNQVFERYIWYNSWTPWVNVSIVSGSNANGSYLRVGSVQICWARAPGFLTTDTAAGAVFQTAAPTTFTFPAAFSAPPIVTPIADKQGGGAGAVWPVLSSSTPSNNGFNMVLLSTANGAQAKPAYIATGSWQ